MWFFLSVHLLNPLNPGLLQDEAPVAVLPAAAGRLRCGGLPALEESCAGASGRASGREWSQGNALYTPKLNRRGSCQKIHWHQSQKAGDQQVGLYNV